MSRCRYAETYGRAQDFADAPLCPPPSSVSQGAAGAQDPAAASPPTSSFSLLGSLALAGGGVGGVAEKERSNEEELAALRVKAENGVPLVLPGIVVVIRMENGNG